MSNRQFSITELMNESLLAPQSIFVVNTTGDTSDSLPGDGFCNDGDGNCSLRGVIQEANAFAGANIIDFNIAGGCNQSIYPASALPAITESVTINGYSQPGALPNTAATGSNAQICIALDGINVGGFTDGLQINAGNTTVRGLNIRRWTDAGVEITTGSGILPQHANGNTIGGTTPEARNVISGNTGNGVDILNCDNNTVRGNYIGTSLDGMTALPNTQQLNQYRYVRRRHGFQRQHHRRHGNRRGQFDFRQRAVRRAN